MHSPLRIDFVHGIKARGGRPGHKQIALRTECEVVRRDTRLQSGEHEHLLVGANLEDRAAAVAHIKILIPIKRDSRCDSHALGVGGHGSVRRYPIDRAVVPRGNIHLPLAIEGNRGRIHHLCNEWLHGVIGIDLEDRDWNLLAART